MTVDFGRKGTKTTNANRIIAFFNAAIQGSDKMVREFKNHPAGTTARALAYVTAPSIALYMVNRNNEEYKKLPRWRKDLFWNIPIKGKFYAVPKPFELGITFGSLPERIMEYIDTQDPHAFDGIASSMWQAGTPAVIPTALIPWIETIANKNLFTGAPLVPQRQKDLEPYLQHKPYTTETAKATGKLINASPSKIENFIRGYTGGLGVHALKGTDTVLRGLGIAPESKQPAKTHPFEGIPGLSAFAVREPGGQMPVIRRFYDMLHDVNRAAKTHGELIKTGRESEAVSYESKHLWELQNVKEIRSAAKKINKIYKGMRDIRKSDLSPEKKRDEIIDAYNHIAEISEEHLETRNKKFNILDLIKER